MLLDKSDLAMGKHLRDITAQLMPCILRGDAREAFSEASPGSECNGSVLEGLSTSAAAKSSQPINAHLDATIQSIVNL